MKIYIDHLVYLQKKNLFFFRKVNFLLNKLKKYLPEQPGPVMDFKTLLVTKDSCTLSWKKPISDGGSRIIAYVLEVLNGEDKWKELLRSKNMQYSAKDLVEGREYKYRVFATNDSGDGPAKDLSVMAKDINGEICDLELH